MFLQHSYRRHLSISTSTFDHQKSTTTKVYYPLASQEGSVPIAFQSEGMAKLLRNKYVRTWFQTSTLRSERLRERHQRCLRHAWSMSTTSEILQRRTRSLGRFRKRCSLSAQASWIQEKHTISSGDRSTTKETTLTSNSTTTTSKQHYKKPTRPNAHTPGAANKPTFADSEPLTPDQHNNESHNGFYPTGHFLFDQGIGKRTTSTNRSRLEESKAFTQIPTGEQTTTHTTTPANNITKYKQGSPRYGCTRGRRSQQDSSSTFWDTRWLRTPNASYNSFELG